MRTSPALRCHAMAIGRACTSFATTRLPSSVPGGVDLRTVAGRLRHSCGGAVTLRVYASFVAAGRRAADLVAVACLGWISVPASDITGMKAHRMHNSDGEPKRPPHRRADYPCRGYTS
jgi:hypothetical protein